MSSTSNIGSLPTGQISMQAPQAVQAHTADGEIAKSSNGAGDGSPAARDRMCPRIS